MKFSTLLILGLICSYGIMKFCLKKTGKLMLAEIYYDRPVNPLFDTRDLSEGEKSEVKTALGQSYRYFGCGGQAYIFFSNDGQYVLKFFKQKHFRKPTYLNYIPFITHFREKKFAKRDRRLAEDYLSYKIAYNEMFDESGLLYLHLNRTSHLQTLLTVVDRLNIAHTIDLDQVDFILQRRAAMIPQAIDQAMRDGNPEEAKRILSEVTHLIVSRCQKGLRDKDPNISTNCGLINGRAIKIDVGRFYHDDRMKDPLFMKAELYHITRAFKHWLLPRYPELADYFEQDVIDKVVL